MTDTARQQQRHRYPLSDGESVSQATYLAVAEVRGCEPLDLPPIAQAVDADALDAFVSNSRTTGDLLATFEYADHVITITPGEVRVEDR